MVFSLKEGFSRIDLSAGRGQSAAVIFDAAQGRMTMLMLDEKMYLAQAMPKPPTGAALTEGAAGTAVEITTTKEKLLG
jgi:hypothetical protein